MSGGTFTLLAGWTRDLVGVLRGGRCVGVVKGCISVCVCVCVCMCVCAYGCACVCRCVVWVCVV